jgi:gamma-glutamyltranspeptidase / glutathione hydrolase
MNSIVLEADSSLPWTRHGVGSMRGVVAAAHPLAAQAGARIIREGGNAFDGAVAAAAALNVVEPYMSGFVGMGVATCYVAAEDRVRCLDFVPLLSRGLPSAEEVPDVDFAQGARSTGVPGNLAGWAALLEAYGRRTLSEVLAPAIELADEGFPLTSLGSRTITKSWEDTFAGRSDVEPWRRVYGDHGAPPQPGFVLRQRRLAETLREIQTEGPRHLYGGKLGQAVVAAVRAHGGYLELDDLEAVAPEWLEPLEVAYRGLRVASLPPPSEAFQFLVTLSILDHVNLGDMEPNGPDHLDTLIRAIRLAAIERIADNLPTPERLAALLERAASGEFSERLLDGAPVEGPTEQYPLDGSAPIAGRSQKPSQHTTSLSVADSEGNVVCLTQSLGSAFGCGVVMEDEGICLNNFLMWGDRHAKGTKLLRPQGRLALPIAPSIATSGGRPVAAIGTPGSYGIPQTQAQVYAQRVDFGKSIQEALEAPRARVWDGRRVMIESRVDGHTMAVLRDRGHEVEEGPPWTRQVGGFHAVTVDPETGAMLGGFDPRRDGYVATP